jgi:hypothetical protein
VAGGTLQPEVKYWPMKVSEPDCISSCSANRQVIDKWLRGMCVSSHGVFSAPTVSFTTA